MLAAATVVGLRFARTLTKPLAALEKRRPQPGRGDLAARAPATAARRRSARSPREFNEMVARLDALLRSQQEFVADASHQLRTPLTALRLRLENLERDVARGGQDGPRRRARRGRAARAARRRAAGARTGRRGRVRARQPVDLAAVVDDAGRRVVARLRRARRRRSTSDLRRRPARARDARLARAGARQPALERARTSRRPATTITIEAALAGRRRGAPRRDEGPGMTAEQRARAFDRFWRAGPPAAGPASGSRSSTGWSRPTAARSSSARPQAADSMW